MGCNLASRDAALDAILRLPQWEYLAPLKRLKPLYSELKKSKHRLRKNGERKQDGSFSSNPMRMGPLTMEARRLGLFEVFLIQEEINRAANAQGRPEVSLINDEEHGRIKELMAANTWPNGWDGTESRANVLLPQVLADGSVQDLLMEATGE